MLCAAGSHSNKISDFISKSFEITNLFFLDGKLGFEARQKKNMQPMLTETVNNYRTTWECKMQVKDFIMFGD